MNQTEDAVWCGRYELTPQEKRFAYRLAWWSLAGLAVVVLLYFPPPIF
jgi:hypothetical protein